MTIEARVAGHYAHGYLSDAIDSALNAAGADFSRLTPLDLAPVDQFHVGGQEATAALFDQLALSSTAAWLDIGSGLGGPARHIASAYGCRVTGIDLTAEYVEVAADLTRRVGLQHLVSFEQGSAMSLPFADESFDGASLLHVGMNIQDKLALCTGVRRVLRPGGTFAIYDIMRLIDGDLAFPLPWASTPDASFVATPADYRAALQSAGFSVAAERDRADFALASFRAARERAAAQNPGAVRPNIAMGRDAPQKVLNLANAITAGLIAPIEMIARVQSP